MNGAWLTCPAQVENEGSAKHWPADGLETENAIHQALATVATNMPLNSPPAGSPGQHGLDFANVLRDSLSGAVIAINSARKVTGFNPQAEQLFRLKAGAVLGQSAQVLPTQIQEILGECFALGQAINDRSALL